MTLFQFDKLVAAFQNLLTVQKEIMGKKTVLSTKLNSLKDTYSQLVKTNSKKIFLFCLDSFYFQYKILTIEMDNINRFSSLINNRMYGDYFKLYNIMLTQMQDRSEVGSTAYPVYKELEPFLEYKMSDIIHLHRDILRLLHFLHKKFNDKQVHIQNYSDEINVGRSITSFLHTHEYENTLLREQIMLYVNYLEFFHTTQTSYMTKLFLHLDRFQREMEEEILTNYASMKPADLLSHPADLLESATLPEQPLALTEIEESFCSITESITVVNTDVSNNVADVSNNVADVSNNVADVSNNVADVSNNVVSTQNVGSTEVKNTSTDTKSTDTKSTDTKNVASTDTKNDASTKSTNTKNDASTKSTDTKNDASTTSTDTKSVASTTSTDTKSVASTTSTDTKNDASTKSTDTKSVASTTSTDTKNDASTKSTDTKSVASTTDVN